MECGEVMTTKAACYMFRPCLPVVTVESKAAGDKRYRFGGAMLGTREQAVRLAEREKLTLHVHKGRKGEAFLYWAPATKKELAAKKREEKRFEDMLKRWRTRKWDADKK